MYKRLCCEFWALMAQWTKLVGRSHQCIYSSCVNCTSAHMQYSCYILDQQNSNTKFAMALLHYFCNSINFHEDLMICNFCHLLAHCAVWPDSQQQDYWRSLSPSALQTPRDNSANWHQKLSRLDKISRRPSFLVVMITLSLLSLCHVLRVEELK